MTETQEWRWLLESSERTTMDGRKDRQCGAGDCQNAPTRREDVVWTDAGPDAARTFRASWLRCEQHRFTDQRAIAA